MAISHVSVKYVHFNHGNRDLDEIKLGNYKFSSRGFLKAHASDLYNMDISRGGHISSTSITKLASGPFCPLPVYNCTGGFNLNVPEIINKRTQCFIKQS